ncbi:hypothetical protein F4801DRAFT_579982 [Xylaria longipes]|nr:hypothetical protein F4801DRAFT_579982 [Xylaria longipes]
MSAIIPSWSGVLDLRMTSENDGWGSAQLSAFHCAITTCVRTYSAVMVDSTLSEKLLSSVMMRINRNFEDDEMRGLRASLLRLIMSRTLRNAKANIDAAPEPSSSEGQEETVWYPEDCVWSFDEKSRYAILQELMSQTGGVAVGTIAARNLWMNGTTNIASINSYFQKLPDIMTAMIRNQGGRAALVGLAILFLVLVFSQGPRELSFRAWKSSPLALLFLSMDESRYDVNYYGMTKNDINHFAESVSVQLKRDQEGRVTFS